MLAGVHRITRFLSLLRQGVKIRAPENVWREGVSSCRYELPIRIPVRKTSAPPSATCMAAESGGVSMKR